MTTTFVDNILINISMGAYFVHPPIIFCEHPRPCDTVIFLIEKCPH